MGHNLWLFPFIVTGSSQRIDTVTSNDLTDEERLRLAELCNAGFCGPRVGTRGMSDPIPGYGIPGLSSQTILQDQVRDDDDAIPLDRAIPRQPEQRRRWVCNTRCQLAGPNINNLVYRLFKWSGSWQQPTRSMCSCKERDKRPSAARLL